MSTKFKQKPLVTVLCHFADALVQRFKDESTDSSDFLCLLFLSPPITSIFLKLLSQSFEVILFLALCNFHMYNIYILASIYIVACSQPKFQLLFVTTQLVFFTHFTFHTPSFPLLTRNLFSEPIGVVFLYFNLTWYINSCAIPGGSDGKDSACHVGDLDSIPGFGRSQGEGNNYPFQYPGLENSIDCTAHGVAKSWI